MGEIGQSLEAAGLHPSPRNKGAAVGQNSKAFQDNKLQTTDDRIQEPDNIKKSGRAFNALGNNVRRRILSAVTGREKTISQLAREFNLHGTTLRYHIEFLLSHEMVEEVEPTGSKTVGRPALAYRAVQSPIIRGFPERRYEVIVDLALQTLVDAIGLKKAARHLAEKGRASGLLIIEQAKAHSDIEEWGPDCFQRLVLDGVLKEFGVVSQTISKSRSDLLFRVFNCPFLEVAVNSPEIICDSLDRGFHEGIDEAVGGATTTRHACLGHGDSYCEYRIAWPNRRRMEHPNIKKRRKGNQRGKSVVS